MAISHPSRTSPKASTVEATTIEATVITADDLEIDSGTLSIDAANDRVGVGLISPKTKLTVEGAVTLKEQASADGDTAAYGQLWVKTATPNELYFTTDAGNDIQLTSGTSVVGPASAVSMSNGADNRITTATGAAALNGEANLTYDGKTLVATSIKGVASAAFTDATCDYNNDPTITMDSTALLQVGWAVSGSGIPANAYIGSITDSTTFELADALGGALSSTGGSKTNQTLTFTPYAASFTSGHVGIGTNQPAAPLHVRGAAPTVYFEDTEPTYTLSFTDGLVMGWGSVADTDAFMEFGPNAGTGRNHLDTAGRDFHLFGTNTTVGFCFDESAGTFGFGTVTPCAGSKVTIEGPVSIKEQANAGADVGAYGQLWVKTATPNELYFTTDAGDDIQLTSGTSAAGGGGSNDDVDLILHMQVFS